MAVVWHEDRKYIQKDDLVVLVLLQFGDDERHHQFVFHLGAPLVHRCHPPPPSAPIAGPIGREESSFSQRASGGRSGPPLSRCNDNGDRRRGGRHGGSTLVAAVLCISGGCMDHDDDGEASRRERGGAIWS